MVFLLGEAKVTIHLIHPRRSDLASHFGRAMKTVVMIYAAISVTFSLGFVAGAWWAARGLLDRFGDLEVSMVKRIDDDHVVVRAPPVVVIYCLGQRI